MFRMCYGGWRHIDVLGRERNIATFGMIMIMKEIKPKIAAKSACLRQELNDARASYYELTSATDVCMIHTVCFAGSSGTVGHDQSVAAVQYSLQGVS